MTAPSLGSSVLCTVHHHHRYSRPVLPGGYRPVVVVPAALMAMRRTPTVAPVVSSGPPFHRSSCRSCQPMLLWRRPRHHLHYSEPRAWQSTWVSRRRLRTGDGEQGVGLNTAIPRTLWRTKAKRRGVRRPKSGCLDAAPRFLSRSPFPVPPPRSPTPRSLLPAPRSLLPAPRSLLPAPCSPLPRSSATTSRRWPRCRPSPGNRRRLTGRSAGRYRPWDVRPRTQHAQLHADGPEVGERPGHRSRSQRLAD